MPMMIVMDQVPMIFEIQHQKGLVCISTNSEKSYAQANLLVFKNILSTLLKQSKLCICKQTLPYVKRIYKIGVNMKKVI